MVPVDLKKNVIIIDDLHLEHHYKDPKISEFLYCWKRFKGYFDTKIGMFKHISNFSYVCTVNTEE